MSIEWGPATRAAAKRQAEAIRSYATNSEHLKLADRAEAGEFTDYADTFVCPITELRRLCRQLGLVEMARRLERGEFDATKAESDEWADSSSGKAVMEALFGAAP